MADSQLDGLPNKCTDNSTIPNSCLESLVEGRVQLPVVNPNSNLSEASVSSTGSKLVSNSDNPYAALDVGTRIGATVSAGDVSPLHARDVPERIIGISDEIVKTWTPLFRKQFLDFQNDIRDHLQSQTIVEYTPESSKIIFVDKRLTVSAALRSMHEYRRPFACVYDDDNVEYTFVFDAASSRAFFLHIWSYYNDSQYVKNLRGLLREATRESHILGSLNEHMEEEKIEDEHLPFQSREDINSEGDSLRSNLEENLEKKSKNIPINDGYLYDDENGADGELKDSPLVYRQNGQPQFKGKEKRAKYYSLSNFESPNTKPKIVKYRNLLSALAVSESDYLINFSSSAEDSGTDKTTLENKLNSPPISGGIIKSTDVPEEVSRSLSFGAAQGREKILSVHRELEMLIGAPWEYTLERWQKFCGSVSSNFPFLSMQCSVLHAMQLCLDITSEYSIVWNEERGCPFSFLTLSSILGHVVQHIHGQFPMLQSRVLKTLGLGQTDPKDIDIVVDTMSLRDVLVVMRDRQRWCIPIVSEATGHYIGVFSDSHFQTIIAKSIFAEVSQISLDWDAPILHYWEILVSMGAAHPTTAVQTYNANFESDDEDNEDCLSVSDTNLAQSSDTDERPIRVPELNKMAGAVSRTVNRPGDGNPAQQTPVSSNPTGMVVGGSQNGKSVAPPCRGSPSRPAGGTFLSRIQDAVQAQKVKQVQLGSPPAAGAVQGGSRRSSAKSEFDIDKKSQMQGGVMNRRMSNASSKDHRRTGNQTPTLLNQPNVKGPSAGKDVTPNLSGTAAAVQCLVSSIACSAAVGDKDMTLGNAILHMVLTDDHCIVFVNPKTMHIRAAVTPRDICRALTGHASVPLHMLPSRSNVPEYHTIGTSPP